MKKLGKKMNGRSETIEAYGCACGCYANCSSSCSGNSGYSVFTTSLNNAWYGSFISIFSMSGYRV